MDYELAKQLKDAGFKQGTGTYYLDDTRRASGPPEFVEHFVAEYEAKDTKVYKFAYVPTLEELIEACGEKFHYVGLTGDKPADQKWAAATLAEILPDYIYAPTPTEAVARLWLALNKP